MSRKVNYTEENTKGTLWRKKFKENVEMDAAAELGLLPSEELDEEALDIIERYEEYGSPISKRHIESL